MAYTEDELFAKLERADAAGDAEAAKVIADEIRRVRAQPVALQKSKPKASVQDLYNRALKGDKEAEQEYNVRAQTYSEPVFSDARKQYNPTEGQSFGQNAWQSFGSILPKLARNFDSPEQVARARELDEPLLSTGGGITGNIAGNLALYAGPQAGLTRGLGILGKAAPYVSGTITGGVAGAAEPVSVGESRGGNAGRAAIWGAAGQAAGDVLGTSGSYIASKVKPAGEELFNAAKTEGIKLVPSQITNSPILKYLQSQSKTWIGSGANGIQESQQKAFNNSLLGLVKQKGETISDDVMAASKKGYSDLYNQSLAGQTIKFDKNTLDEYTKLREWMPGRVKADDIEQFDKLMAQYQKDITRGKITGEIYQTMRNELRDLAASNKDKYGEALKRFKSVLDNSAERSLPKENLAMFREADSLFRNHKVIEQALTRKAGAFGDVKPESLWPIVNRKYKSTPEMRDMAVLGAKIADTLPQSGTVPRAEAERLANLGLLGLAMAIPKATVGRAVNSPMLSRYLIAQPKLIEGGARNVSTAVSKGALPVYLARPKNDEKKKKPKSL